MTQKHKQIWGSLALACGLLLPVFCYAAVDHLVISQVQIAGQKSTDDFIEIYNPAGYPVNLKNHRLVKRTEKSAKDDPIKSWGSDLFIPSGGFFLWANSDFATIGTTTNATTTASIAADNGIALRQGSADAGTIIDSLAWGSADNGFAFATRTNPGSFQAIVRDILDQETSTYSILPGNPRSSLIIDIPPDQTSSSTPTSTPETTQNAASTSASSTLDYLTQSFNVKIYRFLPNPAGDDAGREWVELESTEDKDVLLDGWFLDDKNTGSGPAGDALVLSGIIAAGEVKRFILPIEVFALNNSGGDEINLYFSDKTLGNSAAYSVAAYDDGVFELRDGAWLPPVQAPSGGLSNSGSSGQVNNGYFGPASIEITEVLANPTGADEGKEWVEVFNFGNATTSLAGWKLDDNASSTQPGSNAVTLGNIVISPQSYLVITIPRGRFVLNNSGGDTVRLFKPDNSLLQSITFPEAPEGQSYSAAESKEWSYGLPTPGFANINDLPLASVIISELLPNPNSDEDEFLEIYNSSTSTGVNLENFKIIIGTREKVLENIILASSSYYALFQGDLPAHLNNSGHTVTLVDNWGRQLSKITYEKAAVGQAFAESSGSFFWTEKPTPGEENQIVLSASTEPELAKLSAKAQVQSRNEINYSKLYQESKKMNQELGQRLDALQAQVALLEEKTGNGAESVPVMDSGFSEENISEPSRNLGLYVLVVVLASGFLGLLIKQYLWKNPFK